jgi:hypothetical protein
MVEHHEVSVTPLQPRQITVPTAAASIGVPVGAPMSIPGWTPPQHGPGGLVIGQIMAAAFGAGAWVGAALGDAAEPVVDDDLSQAAG